MEKSYLVYNMGCTSLKGIEDIRIKRLFMISMICRRSLDLFDDVICEVPQRVLKDDLVEVPRCNHVNVTTKT